MTDVFAFWFDLLTAAFWFALATAGAALRVRQLIRLYRIKPVEQADIDYLASVKRSTWLRLGVKLVFLVGSLIALFNLPLFGVWRIGVILALGFMIAETVGVDRVRSRLGRSEEAG